LESARFHGLRDGHAGGGELEADFRVVAGGVFVGGQDGGGGERVIQPCRHLFQETGFQDAEAESPFVLSEPAGVRIQLAGKTGSRRHSPTLLP
jgi:hypothetical protein